MILKTLLFPFAVLYGWVTDLRNILYNRGIRPSVRFDLPVISVGNLTVGGTGKTPMVEYLVRLLSSGYRAATLSRGYGRKTKGFRLAGAGDSAETIGDEPYQYYQKFGSKIHVAVGEERAMAIPLLLQEDSGLEVVLLDDAFQHRRVQPSFNLLLCDYTRPFYEDLVMPAGRLRESKHNASRADAVIVTKCPHAIGEEEMMRMEHRVRKFVSQPVFFSTIRYGSPVPFDDTNADFSKDVILVTGIGNPEPLTEYVIATFSLRKHIGFADHHFYTSSDLKRIGAEVEKEPECVVLTTEKDMVKLVSPTLREFVRRIPFFYLPITVQFLKDGREFDEMILDHVRGFHQKY